MTESGAIRVRLLRKTKKEKKQEDDSDDDEEELALADEGGEENEEDQPLVTEEQAKKKQKILETQEEKKDDIVIVLLVGKKDLCIQMTSPLLTYLVKVEDFQAKDGFHQAKQSVPVKSLVKIVRIIPIPAKRILSLSKLKRMARDSDYFDSYLRHNKAPQRNKTIAACFDALTKAKTENYNDAPTLEKYVTSQPIHKDVLLFCRNVGRSKDFYTMGAGLGWSFCARLTEEEIMSIPELSEETALTLLRSVLFYRGAELIPFSQENCDHYASLCIKDSSSKEIYQPFEIVRLCNSRLIKLQKREFYEKHAGLEKVVGPGEFEITLSEVQELQRHPSVVRVEDLMTTEGKVVLKSAALALQEDALIKNATLVTKERLSFVDVQEDMRFQDREDPYIDLLRNYASGQYGYTSVIIITIKERVAVLKRKINSSNVHVFDFFELFPLTVTDIDVPFINKRVGLLKLPTDTRLFVLDRSHCYSLVQMAHLFLGFSKLAADKRTRRLILCGNKRCFPDSNGMPFADIVNAFPDQCVTLSPKTFFPKIFVDTPEKLIAYLKENKIEVSLAEYYVRKGTVVTLPFSFNVKDVRLLRLDSPMREYMFLDVRSSSNKDEDERLMNKHDVERVFAIAPVRPENLIIIGSREELRALLESKKKRFDRYSNASVHLLLEMRDKINGY
jgi:hypothetical protein